MARVNPSLKRREYTTSGLNADVNEWCDGEAAGEKYGMSMRTEHKYRDYKCVYKGPALIQHSRGVFQFEMRY